MPKYRRAHDIEPKNLYALVNLGGMCAALGRTEEARKWYRDVRAHGERDISRKAADHWTYLCLGEAAVALGDEEAAVAAYQQAIVLEVPVEDLRSASEQLEFLVKRGFAADTVPSPTVS